MNTIKTNVSPATDGNAPSQPASEILKKRGRKLAAQPKEKPVAPKAPEKALEHTAESKRLRERRDAILRDYKPETADLTAADASMVAAIAPAARAEANVQIASVARLAMAIRDVAYWLSTPKASGAQIAPNAEAAVKLFQHIKRVAKKSVQATAKAPGKNVEVTLRIVPQWRTVSDNTWRNACKAAMLLVYGKTTKVHIAYAPGDKLPGNTVISDVPFVAQGKIPGVCVPFNVLAPVRFGDRSAAANKDGLFTGINPVENEDDTSRWVDTDTLDTLYLIHFADIAPSYAVTSKDRGVIPSGMLVPYKAPRKKSESAGTQGASTLDKIVEKLGDSDPMALVLTLATRLRDKRPPDWGTSKPIDLCGAIFALANVTLDQCQSLGMFSGKEAAAGKNAGALVDLANKLNAYVECPDEKAGTFWTRNATGDGHGPVLSTKGGDILPKAPATKAA